MVKLEQTSRDNVSNWRKARLYGCPLGSRSIWWNVPWLSAKPCQHREAARRQTRLPRGRGREGKRKRERGQGQGSKISNRGTEARNGCRQAPLGRLRTWKRERRGVRRVSFCYSTASHVVTSLWHITWQRIVPCSILVERSNPCLLASLRHFILTVSATASAYCSFTPVRNLKPKDSDILELLLKAWPPYKDNLCILCIPTM